MSISTRLSIGLLMISIVPVSPGLAIEPQGPEAGVVPFRPLASFRFLHIPVPAGDEGKLNREFLKQISQPGDKLWPVPFGWKIQPAVPPDAGTDFLLASVRPHPSIKPQVVVTFTDVNGRPIAVIEGKPAPLRRTTTSSIMSVVFFDLRDLNYQTGGADRLVGSFKVLRLRATSDGIEALLQYIASDLRQHGRWTVIDAAADVAATEAGDVLECSVSVVRGAPAVVKLRCEDRSGRLVARMEGSNCRSCYGAFQFSPNGDTRRAASNLVKQFIEHQVRVERVYAPQLRGTR